MEKDILPMATEYEIGETIGDDKSVYVREGPDTWKRYRYPRNFQHETSLKDEKRGSHTIHIPVGIHIEDIPYSKSVIEAMRVIDPVSSLWNNLLAEIERIQPGDEENPTQRPFICECGATVVWKAWRHDDGVYCDVCGRYYALEEIDALTCCETLEVER